jgi:hypothetical protein
MRSGPGGEAAARRNEGAPALSLEREPSADDIRRCAEFKRRAAPRRAPMLSRTRRERYTPPWTGGRMPHRTGNVRTSEDTSSRWLSGCAFLWMFARREAPTTQR